jgi:hypothetical protein
MATIKKGILGGFSGKVGTVIGSNWKGIDYIRSLPKSSSKPASLAQKDQRLRFTTVMKFLKPIYAVLNIGYQSVKGIQTPLNAAVSYHMKNAITGTSPDYELDMSKVVFSQGELVGPWLPTIGLGLTGELEVRWQNNNDMGGFANADDDAFLLIYNADKLQFVVLEHAASRSEEAINLILPANFSGDELACWMSFVTKDGKKTATSVFIGKITV